MKALDMLNASTTTLHTDTNKGLNVQNLPVNNAAQGKASTGERAFQSAGHKPETRVWMMEGRSVRLLTDFEHGWFFSDHCYIFLVTTKRKDNNLYHEIGCWSGRLVTDEVQGAAMFKVYELRQCLNSNLVAVHREVENHESYFFLSIFKTIRYTENANLLPSQATKPDVPAPKGKGHMGYSAVQHMSKPGPMGPNTSGGTTLAVPVGNSTRSSVSTGPASIVATSNTSENSVPGPAGATANQISSSNSVMNIPTLMRFRKANTIRPGAPTTTVFIEEIALIPNDADTPNLQPQLASGDATSLPPATRPAFIVSKKDWTPDKQSVYVYDGPSYVWMLITAVMEKSSGRDHSGTASTSAREHVNNSTTTVLAMERTTATEWAKELAHIRGHMRFEVFDETEPTQKTFWESIGIYSTQDATPKPVDAPPSTSPPPTVTDDPHPTTSDAPPRRTFTRGGADPLKPTAPDRNPSIEIPSTPHITKTLFKATDLNVVRTLQYEEVAKGSKLKSSSLMSSAIHFLDASDCFYVWVGNGARLQREPMGLAVEFLVKTGRPFELPIVGLEEGAENDWFLSNFEVDADGGSRDGGLNIVVAGA